MYILFITMKLRHLSDQDTGPGKKSRMLIIHYSQKVLRINGVHCNRVPLLYCE